MAARYRFTEQWWFDAAPDRVAELLDDVEHYDRWWPAVHPQPRAADSEPTRDVGARRPRQGLVVVRAPLGYRLRILLTEEPAADAQHAHPTPEGESSVAPSPRALKARVTGDLNGVVRWRIEPDCGGTRVDFEQQVTVARRWLRWGSPLLRPVFARQHARVMAAARTGLERALAVPGSPLHDRAGRGT